MDAKFLSRIDLNLLVALQILLEEQSVTKAADRLFITQPAMSKTLQRLRELFDDPLFIRSGRGLVPTPRAVELEKQLPVVLSSVSDLVVQSEFDPLAYEGEISIMTAEFIAVQVMPTLTNRLINKAPFMSLLVRGEFDGKARALEDGGLDFVIEIARPYSEEFHVTPLGHFLPSCWNFPNLVYVDTPSGSRAIPGTKRICRSGALPLAASVLIIAPLSHPVDVKLPLPNNNHCNTALFLILPRGL